MRKVYYIWGPKYIDGDLNGPDLVAGVIYTEGGRLELRGRHPELLLGDMAVEDVENLMGEEAEVLFHMIVNAKIPAAFQVVFDNASELESRSFLKNLHLDGGRG
jgi:hypothetical protein